ncbi:MAG: excinuclease ABC subunit C, partial [Candidatus Omnitrophica bacterium]|nr:excinuclease ABC subunit C [Candidatus Omnitrophota bacterium]MBU1851130.1 excinuclease ABC subunit C [Candidatus Omnitrophota bacterium]
YHRKLRQKKAFESGLREIKGIGEARERRLMEKFGTLNNIRKATVEEIEEAGIARAVALAVVKSFQLKADS